MDNKLKLLNFLAKHVDEAFTMHALAKRLDIPYATFYRSVSRMEELLVMQRVGRAKTLSINLAHPVITSYLAISSEEERKAFVTQQPHIRIINNELKTEDIVLLFGSYARREETEQSDIDIMVINRRGNRTVSFAKHELIFRKEINSFFFKESEFKAMLRDKDENVGKQALREHIVLSNPSRFWDVVCSTIRSATQNCSRSTAPNAQSGNPPAPSR